MSQQIMDVQSRSAETDDTNTLVVQNSQTVDEFDRSLQRLRHVRPFRRRLIPNVQVRHWQHKKSATRESLRGGGRREGTVDPETLRIESMRLHDERILFSSHIVGRKVQSRAHICVFGTCKA